MSDIKIKGRVRLICYKDGKEKWDTGFQDNLITDAGLGFLAGRAGNLETDPLAYIALGTGTTAAAADQTALVSEITTNGLDRAAATASYQTTATLNDTFRLTASWTATATTTVEEVGCFSDATAGTMVGRILSEKTVQADEELKAIYDIVFARSA